MGGLLGHGAGSGHLRARTAASPRPVTFPHHAERGQRRTPPPPEGCRPAGPDSMPWVRIGIIILPDLRWREASRRWCRAEEYGFAHAWTYDHLGWRDLVDGPWFDAVPTLTAAAMVTSRIQLGTMVASPNFRHPVSFARQLTALDDVSQGRLVLRVGA